MEKKTMNRRDFLQRSTILGVGGIVGVSAIASACKGPKYVPLRKPEEYYIPELPDKAIAGKEIKVGVIGCGGRGSGAIQNLFDAADGIKLAALGDVFPDRLEGLRKMAAEKLGQEVPDENCFIGFDAYQKVIDSGVDMIIDTTPPVFRPDHFKYAVQKGVHSFLEKPVAVDAKGYRTVMAAAKQAQAKGLCVVCGTQRHHERPYVEAFRKIQEGYIGEITGGNVYWNQGMLWYRNREKGWSDMEWMIRDWVNWKWLSGDHIVEQHVHNIDVFLWMSGLKVAKATGFGARHRRITGDQYDQFSIDFEMENGVHLHSMCRQIDGCSNAVGEIIYGTKGTWNSFDHEIKDLEGNLVWKFDNEKAEAEFQQHNPYVLEHVDLVNHIRKGEPIDEATACATSTLAGVMGRTAAYTGDTVTWDDMSQSGQNYLPEKLEVGPVDMSGYTVQVPGKAK
ncbi:MAG: Gfo/Idh/MocA family protein [Candidatus Cryptobacteroides sp.]